MTSDDEPISVWDIIERPERRPVLEARLRLGSLGTEFDAVGGHLLGHGSQGGTVGELATGEVVFVKRSDRSVQGALLGEAGREWVRNEAGAYEIARILGFEDIVLPTVLRSAVLDDGTEIEVAVRLYVEASVDGRLEEGAALFLVDDDQLARAAIFDFIVEQADRRVVDGLNGGNWYVLEEPDRVPRLLLFDHQQCFGARDGMGLNSGIWDVAGHKIGPHLQAVESLVTEEARSRMLRYLRSDQVNDVVRRASHLLGT
jgi:hypothetical protein